MVRIPFNSSLPASHSSVSNTAGPQEMAVLMCCPCYSRLPMSPQNSSPCPQSWSSRCLWSTPREHERTGWAWDYPESFEEGL